MLFPTPEEFVAQSFDYIVIGGGTAGLVVAARLSEDPNVTVGVLEAGTYHAEDPLIDVPGYFARALGNPKYDWAYLTVPQANVNGRLIFHPRGKLLGGTSALNFMTTGRASKEEYDALETLGNEGWNWNEMLKYIKKSETVHLADTTTHSDRHNAVFDPAVHGDSGPMHKSFAGWASDLSVPFYDALETLGVPRNADAANGFASGSYTVLSFVDPETAKRSYTASAYFEPNASRSNLVVLPYAQVSKLILTGSAEPYVVSGVQFTVKQEGLGDEVYEVKVKKEVVLSAGSFGTPQILELSGIGRPDVLRPLGIDVKVDLPVGENLQDHVYVASTYEVSNKLTTLDLLRDAERLASETALLAQGQGMYSSTHSAFAFLPANVLASSDEIKRMKQVIEDSAVLSASSGQNKQKELLQEWFDDERHPQIEIITYPGFFPAPGKTPRPGAHYHTVLVGLMHPASRGTVHITSSSSSDKPAVDPAYLSSTVDRDLLVHAVRFVKKMQDTEPLKELTTSYVEPAWLEDEPETDETLREFVKNGLEPIYHPAGTAAMLPRTDGGVVDARLKVYGTANLRVVDASVIPIHIAAHPASTIIGMAEKAADIIKADARA